jgi:tartrate-resistant acid phosphatase type 5
MIEFFILGDMGSGEDAQYIVANDMKQKLNTYKEDRFICGLGDNIYEKGVSSVNDTQFNEKFEVPYKDINIPFQMCLGNHDYGEAINNEWPASDIQVEYSSNSTKWKMDSKYYTFRKTDKTDKTDKPTTIDFFVFDTNLNKMKPHEIETQKRKMIQKIKDSNADWKIAYGHHTFISVGGHGNADDIFETFITDIFKEAPFDVYMCGHDHNKQVIRTKIDFNELCLIVCGTGGKVYHNKDARRRGSYCNYDNIDENSTLEYCSNNLGYGIIQASKTETQSRLKIEFMSEGNISEYKCELTKKKSNK